MSKIEQVNDYFKLPISYTANKMELKQHIITDLELTKLNIDDVKNIEPEPEPDTANKSMYQYLFNPKTVFGEKVIEQWANHYTDNVAFLKESQQLLKTYKPVNTNIGPDAHAHILNVWNDIKNDTGFKEKYNYIDWSRLEFLNKDERFLQLMSMYNLTSPILSLFLPIIILIIPFFIIKLKGFPITTNEYIVVLKMILKNHALGKLFNDFSNVPIEQKIYIALSTAFYFFSIYQNILSCIRFNSNMIKIHLALFKLREYINHTINSMKNLLQYTSNLATHNIFNEEVQEHLSILEPIKSNMDSISSYQFNIKKIYEIGNILKTFYALYDDPVYNKAIMYSFGFNGYIDNLEGVIENINNKHLHFATYTSKKTTASFKKIYYPALIGSHSPIIKNNCNMKHNMIISGPNASGKTTMLKSILINILFSQQLGVGFYDSVKLNPFKHIHCYLNIPDTSGRDSLFQAEARRCKDIIDCIKINKKDTHFCVFDELYSGTNPQEAVMSAFAFMSYLSKIKSVKTLLTTHFSQLCKFLEQNQSHKNYHMETIQNGSDNFKYTYVFKEGISTVKGGIKVLIDMEYPKEILDDSANLLTN